MSARERIENLVESFMEYEGELPLLLTADVARRDFPKKGSVANTINPSATIDGSFPVDFNRLETKGSFSTKSIIAGEAVLREHRIAIIFVGKHFTAFERMGSTASPRVPASVESQMNRPVGSSFALPLGSVRPATGGAKFVHTVNNAKSKRLSLVTFYDDGTVIDPKSEWLSFIQLANIVTALEQLSAENVPHITVLTSPYWSSGFTTSFPLGDIVLAEPKPADSKMREKNNHKHAIKEQTFQLAVSEVTVPLEDNVIDGYVSRKKLKEALDTLLSFFAPS